MADIIPSEIFLYILAYINQKEPIPGPDIHLLMKLQLVCKNFKNIIDSKPCLYHFKHKNLRLNLPRCNHQGNCIQSDLDIDGMFNYTRWFEHSWDNFLIKRNYRNYRTDYYG